MRAIRVASAALLGLTALTFTAPSAFADDGDTHNITPFGFSVQPSTIAAGGRLSLLLKRDGGCNGTVRISSGVFDTVSIPSGRSSATATVDRDARQGAVYEVTFLCDGVSGHTDITIGTGTGTGRSDDLSPVQVPAQQGVRAGVGGSVGGFDVKAIGLGAALVGGSVGVAWYMSRRCGASDDS
ncbi:MULTISPECIES: hypothetical protein [unclassified Streptomyces]|uniref:hypothetical protein n=1 Tax=unclassified Streptomyces TaxID=2593676 RepID=UPI002E81E830|nr:hypothetical protein [Streptomyces sp. NBC_00589]WTI34300.1 hypothetical protein OIC96_04490 [Streptomyces sp. NBC_00775]WUB32028.1 hypothetical protein OHA51_45240 [Streptomyces sp. NBC_00589]